MHNHIRHVGLMHPAQHLRKVGDRTPVQQPLHRQLHDVGLGPASIGLVTQRVAEEIFIPWTRGRIHWIRFCHTFCRLHHDPVSSLIQ